MKEPPDTSTRIEITTYYGSPENRDGGRWGELPVWLDGPAHAVLNDFQDPTPLPLSLGYSELETPGFASILVDVDDVGVGGFAFGLDTAMRGAQLLVHLADGIQEHISDIESARGEARPPCPEHAHPVVAREVDGEAWWVCPRNARRVRPIGKRQV